MIRHKLKTFVADESGATAIEYGLIATLISLVVIAAVTTTGTALYNKMGNVNTAIK